MEGWGGGNIFIESDRCNHFILLIISSYRYRVVSAM